MSLRLPAFICLLLFAPLLAADPDVAARKLFEEFFEESVALSPMFQTRLGRKTRYGEWDDISPAQSKRYHQMNRRQLARLRALDPDKLNESYRLSYQLMERQLRQQIESYRWRDHSYPVNQMFGWHATLASFLISNHRVDDVEDALAYIARLEGTAPLIRQLVRNLERRANKRIIAPRFVYPHVQRDIANLLSGRPFETSAEHDSPLLEDFRKKVAALDLDDDVRAQLLAAAEQALLQSMQPAYRELSGYLSRLEKKADDRAGVWKLPRGKAFYEFALRRITTTDMSAEEIHQLGLDEVARIHSEIRAIMVEVGFEGDLQAFFDFMENDPRFYYPDTEEGRAAYLERTRELIAAMDARLDDYFSRRPKAELEVRPVEAFREQSAGKAFYQRPSDDGVRPGIYYVNLRNMKEMPKYQMDALVYHEALPGHHMQIALAQEAGDLPSFRRFGGYTAYIEGWGLYAEYLPLEMGFYQDPYANFGRLAMELWRACRLVVDTGLHARRWTREQAIEYLVDNTPMSRSDSTREIERYIVMPGQATSYKIGMNKILELRARAAAELGEQFDIRQFHHVILESGAVPLTVLEEIVSEWLEAQR
jgi:uncharacterized protein (DUF885 family)